MLRLRLLHCVLLNARPTERRAAGYAQFATRSKRGAERSRSRMSAKVTEVNSEARGISAVDRISTVEGMSTVDGMSGMNRPPSMQKELQEKVQAIMADSESDDGWDNCWKSGVTPWDMGSVTPVIQDLVNKGQLPDGRALVPGCGLGYDVLALASESRHVVGMDISPTVNSMSKQMAEANPRGAFVEFIVADFFKYTSEATFNLIFDYTFFCAINPSMRAAWAAKIDELLEPNGELITLMFPFGDFEGGPPFAVSVKAYDEVLSVHGLAMVSCVDNELAVGARKGREKLAHWRRSNSKI